jgi:hypothetical protein
MMLAIQALQVWDLFAPLSVHAMHGYSSYIPAGMDSASNNPDNPLPFAG